MRRLYPTLALAALFVSGFLALGQSTEGAVVQTVIGPLATSTDASYNWSGYVAERGEYTAIAASWRVPDSSHPGTSAAIAADATWVGIGGVSNRDLIQAGTQTLVDDEGNTRYDAWYEVLPAASVPVPLKVSPGDDVSVSLTLVKDNLWHIDFVNNTTNKQYALDVPYRSTLSSAEWIEEMPSYAGGRTGHFIPLSSFGSVTFKGASTVEDGTSKKVGELGASALSMTSRRGTLLASPSVISAGQNFSVVEAGQQQLTSAARSQLLSPL
jgi:hypothetical protein